MPLIRGHHSFDDHFTQIPNAWVRDPRISLKAKGLLAQLMSHQPGWKVSIKALSVANNCGLDSIRSAINELMDAGYLERSQERDRDERGQLSEYNYRTRDPQSPTSENPTLENPTLDNPTPKKNILIEEQRIETNPHPSDEVELEVFEEFWETYPRKVEKIAARRAFVKALREESAEVILAGARRLANDPYLPPKQFIPYPASWLNAGGWTNEPYPERQLTSEEIAQRNKAQAQVIREREMKSSEQLRAAMKAAEEEAKLNPPKLCEHNRVAIICPHCKVS